MLNNDDSAIEPELRQPTPRIIRRKFRVRFVRWLFITLAIIAPAILIGFGVKAQQDWKALRDHGAKTVGKIIEKSARKTGKNAHPPRAKFEYRVADQPHAVWDDLTDDEYHTLLLGAEREIVYLPENPGVSATTQDLTRGGDNSSTAFALWFTAGLLSLIGFPFWLWIESQQRRWQSLLVSGVAVRTTSLTVERSGFGKSRTWKAQYEFPLNGVSQSGRVTVDADIAAKLETPGVEATVLYDPEDPKRYELYLPLAKNYDIDSPQLRF